MREAKVRTVVSAPTNIYIMQARRHLLQYLTSLQRCLHILSLANGVSALRHSTSATVIFEDTGKPGRPTQVKVSTVAARIKSTQCVQLLETAFVVLKTGRSQRMHRHLKRERIC